MQTFVPYENHMASAEVLDNKRLFKQLVEGKQILLALDDPNYGWQNHPATKMWRGYDLALVDYLFTLAEEWRDRGTNRATGQPYEESISEWLRASYDIDGEFEMPSWWGGPIHASHRYKLFWKDPQHYGPLFFGEEWPRCVLEEEPPYYWPTTERLIT